MRQRWRRKRKKRIERPGILGTLGIYAIKGLLFGVLVAFVTTPFWLPVLGVAVTNGW